MSFQEVAESLARWSAEGQRAGVATLVSVKRSAPRTPGARFAANERGDVAGSVSAGCVEGDLLEHIRQVIAEQVPRMVRYGISDEMAAGVGLSCGGEIEVLVSPYPPDNVVWPALSNVVQSEGAALLLTRADADGGAAQLLVKDDGTRTGSLGDVVLDTCAADAAERLFDTGGTSVLELEEPKAVVFAEAFLPPQRLAIIGATPVAAALCHLASFVGMSVSIVDPRQTFADPSRFPDARAVVQRWPEEGLAEVGLDRYWNVVVLAHDQKLDLPGLAAALRARCLYIGQIGGRRTQEQRRTALAELGISDEDLSRIHGPVGLDIGGRSPQEIAVSIIAEIIAVRCGKKS